MDSFAQSKTNEIGNLKNSNDIEFLKNEFIKTEMLLPECAAESLWRTNKLCVIKSRLNVLCPGYDKPY